MSTFFKKVSKFLGMDNKEEKIIENDDNDFYINKSNSIDKTKKIKTNKFKTNNSFNNKIVSINSSSAISHSSNSINKIMVIEPRIYSDAKEVGNYLLNSSAVIVNFSNIDSMQARRIIDFLTGTVFAVQGEIKRIGDQIFLCTPSNFEIDGNLSQLSSNNISGRHLMNE